MDKSFSPSIANTNRYLSGLGIEKYKAEDIPEGKLDFCSITSKSRKLEEIYYITLKTTVTILPMTENVVQFIGKYWSFNNNDSKMPQDQEGYSHMTNKYWLNLVNDKIDAYTGRRKMEWYCTFLHIWLYSHC